MTHIRGIITSDIGQLTCGIFILSFHLFVLCSLLCLLSRLLNLCHFPHFCGFFPNVSVFFLVDLSILFSLCLFLNCTVVYFGIILYLGWNYTLKIYAISIYFCWENNTFLVCFVLRCYLQLTNVLYFFILLLTRLTN